ncbi:heme oxygenase [Pedobacter yulinensis]|uniref:Heme oxygenase n=1 Tax=Pedobacter yulinensis TaxID=2126353 RepID=A0A2T3HNT5_9SPHI|nr:DUF3050 domain-containing protein [Pedobacter yulinensis]PST84086.1 heme oxygenase [Pedobacter yulinensis]
MHLHIDNIREEITPLRQRINEHPLYRSVAGIKELRIFMQFHIYAVWDFMSLLKALQIRLTGVSIPWFPVGDPHTRQLINQIVAGEEADTDETGSIKSHFEMYLDAMQQCGADTGPVLEFLRNLQQGETLQAACQAAGVPAAARQFMEYTFQLIGNARLHETAAAFTFGREDLIPGMFISMVRDLNSAGNGSISKFHYYLERHIEVDGDEHSHLALAMTEKLCHGDPQHWQEASAAAKQSLVMRIALWDAALTAIELNRIRGTDTQ